MDDWVRGRGIPRSTDRNHPNLFPFHLGSIGFVPFPISIKKGAPAVEVGLHLCGHGPEVERHAVDDRVSLKDLFTDSLHIILDYTDAGLVTLTTVKTPGN